MSGALRIDRVVTSGTFSLDGGTWDVDNNVWVVGDDSEVVIIDAAHTAQPIVDAVAGRNVVAVICHPRPRRPRHRRAGVGPRAARPGPSASR